MRCVSLVSHFEKRLRSPAVLLLAATALLAVPSLASSTPSPASSSEASLSEGRSALVMPELCFAPGTPQETIEQHRNQRFWSGLEHSLQATPATRDTFEDNFRWDSTATDGGGLQQGDPMTLTWSIVPDGTSIHNYSSSGTETVSPSDLRSRLAGIYGSEAAYLAIFQQVFDRWGELTGVTYVYEPNDDGSSFQEFFIAPGQLGVRGDVRIAGHHIDGNSGILAYNFFPNTGDMVIDSDDNFYDNTGSNSLGLRNVLAHEHGHGLGMPHVCPVNQTKLMEPFVSFMFDGPQHDDIRAMNRGYGDTYETNDSSGGAAALGAVTSTTLNHVSIDDNADDDWYSFNVNGGSSVDVTVTPIGFNYLSGPQNQNGSCSPGSSFDTLNIQDLAVQVVDQNGVTVLDNSNSGGLGQSESLTDVLLASGAGTYFVRVGGGATNDAQLYQLDLAVVATNDVFADGFESGDESAWSSSTP